MGHKGPVLRPRCIGPGRARTQELFNSIQFNSSARRSDSKELTVGQVRTMMIKHKRNGKQFYEGAIFTQITPSPPIVIFNF